MTIRNIEESSMLRNQGRRLGRDGMSQRVERLVLEFIESGGGYKSAMILAGRIKAVATAARCDDYWTEQVDKGWTREMVDIRSVETVDPDDDGDYEVIKRLKADAKSRAKEQEWRRKFYEHLVSRSVKPDAASTWASTAVYQPDEDPEFAAENERCAMAAESGLLG